MGGKDASRRFWNLYPALELPRHWLGETGKWHKFFCSTADLDRFSKWWLNEEEQVLQCTALRFSVSHLLYPVFNIFLVLFHFSYALFIFTSYEVFEMAELLVFWDMTLGQGVNGSRRFERTYCFHFQVSLNFVLTIEDKGGIFLQTVDNEWHYKASILCQRNVIFFHVYLFQIQGLNPLAPEFYI